MSGPIKPVTLDDLRLAGACPGGLWAFKRAYGDAVDLADVRAEDAAPWLHWIGETLPEPVRARLRRQEWRWWLTEARRHGCDPLDLPSDTVAELRLRLARAVLRAAG